MDLPTGQLEVLRRTIEKLGQPDLTEAVKREMGGLGVGEDEFNDIVMSLKMSRCLEVVEGPRTESGGRTVESIKNITTRGLRILQQAPEPAEVESCPVDPADMQMGFGSN